jgi:ribosomal-protein-alanine N-acetyltransferase
LTADAVRLETPRLFLRIPDADFAPRYTAYHTENLSRLARAVPVQEGFTSLAFWQERLEASAQDFEEDRGVRLVVLRREDLDGPIVGVCNLFGIIRQNLQACHLGYHVAAPFEGRGLMREAVEAALAFAFGPLEIHRVQAGYHPTNERSGALLKRLGFVVEGYARDMFYMNGAWQDCVLTSKLTPSPRPPSEGARAS